MIGTLNGRTTSRVVKCSLTTVAEFRRSSRDGPKTWHVPGGAATEGDRPSLPARKVRAAGHIGSSRPESHGCVGNRPTRVRNRPTRVGLRPTLQGPTPSSRCQPDRTPVVDKREPTGVGVDLRPLSGGSPTPVGCTSDICRRSTPTHVGPVHELGRGPGLLGCGGRRRCRARPAVGLRHRRRRVVNLRHPVGPTCC